MATDPFPLRLTPFEHYLLCDDSPDHPMTVSMRVNYSGELDRERLVDALTTAIRYQPLLRARVEGDIASPTRSLYWVAGSGRPSIVWLDDDTGDEMHCPLNLWNESGLRVFVLPHHEPSCMIVQWHHACCDGLGILAFFETLLLAYRDGAEVAETYLGHLGREQDWWKSRATQKSGWLHRMGQAPMQIRRIVNFMVRKTSPLALRGETNLGVAGPCGTDDFCVRTLRVAESESLLQRARRSGVSVNDILLRDYYTALSIWNSRLRGSDATETIRLAVPVNLRDPGNKHEPAINNVGMVFLDRTSMQIQNADGLLESISQEMQHVKRWKTGWAMIYFLTVGGTIRNGMKRIVESNGPKISSVLSNLGLVSSNPTLVNDEGKLQADSLTIESLEVFAPIRPGVYVAMFVLSYANCLTVTMNYDRTRISRRDANELMDVFIEQLVGSPCYEN